eukprot:6938339-Ditylum_brightwellii.AAC.1
MVRDSINKNQKCIYPSQCIRHHMANLIPYPSQAILDRGTEFMVKVTEIIAKDYMVKKKPITV